MSSFLKQQWRKADYQNKKDVKRRIKEVYKILGELEEVAQKLRESDVEITQENVKEEAAKYTDRNIGSFEEFVLLGKLHTYKKDEEE